MALAKIKVNEIDEKSAPVDGDYALVSDSENDGKLALIPFSEITGGALAPLDSPTFTGTPTAPTAAVGTNTTQIATTKFVQATVNAAIAPIESVNYTYEYTSFTAEPNKKYSVNTSTGDIIITLPELTEEMIGSSISIRIAAGSNEIIVNRSGTNIIAEVANLTTYSFKGAGSYIDIIAFTESMWVITRSNRVAEPSADSDTNVAATTAWVRDVVGEEVGEAADTFQSRWAYQYHLSGGVITGVPWKIHGFGASGTLNLPAASTVPDGTQIAAMVQKGEDTEVAITRDAEDQFITPTGFATSYTLAGVGSSLVFVKATSNTWAALGAQDSLINAAIAPLAPLDSPSFTGTPTAPDASSPTTSSSQIANCKFVQAQKDSPALTGTPTAPTAAVGTNTTQIATTAFVQTAADTLQNRWDYQPYYGGTRTGEQWTIHGFGASGTLNLPKASTLPVGTQIAAIVVSGEDTSVNIVQDAEDQFITPTGFATSYTLAGVGSSIVLVKVQSNTWAALGMDKSLINADGDQLAPLDSPALTGTPTAPTAAVGTNTTQIATTAFVTGAIAACRPKHTYVAITTASTAIAAERGNTYGVNANGCTLTLPAAIDTGHVDGDEICVVLGVTASRELAIVSPGFILRSTGMQPVNTPFNVTGFGTFISFTKCANVWVMH